ncbi:hypothetical protein G647_03318 [Cladophialophora carrionii CBS 160.54]|uniref:Uncharacterized protein n=1 Tax=Cladophialophora carrionii CBS 160.54 TaxID=1279043 RepID=V9DIP7_9EURO|nr:uncharacterized protein G647_03318 [Cladophialophora carrionii CBS 160.54]ETI26541.1 hypothetical protein G647_03318 [Cladophialophora carrionii CBS 160.54]
MADTSFESATAPRYIIPPYRGHESSGNTLTTPTKAGRNGTTKGESSIGTNTNTSSVVDNPRYAVPDSFKQETLISQFKKELPHSLKMIDTDYHLNFFRAELVNQLGQMNTQVSRKPSSKPEYVFDTGASIAFITALAITIERLEKPHAGVNSSVRNTQLERLLEFLDEDYAATTGSDTRHHEALKKYPDIRTTILWALETLRGRVHKLKKPTLATTPVSKDRTTTKWLFFCAMVSLLVAMLYWTWQGL